MRIRQLTKREWAIFTVCAALAVVYGIVFGLVRPFQERKSEIISQIEAKKEVLDKYVKVIAHAKTLERQNEELLGQFQQDATNEQVMSQLLSEIEKQSGEFGLRISDLKPRRVKKEQYYNRFSVSLSIESSLVKIIKFLYTIQGDSYHYDVEEFTVEKGLQRQNDSVKVRLVLSRMYIQKL